MTISWKEIALKRNKDKNAIYKQIKELERSIKAIGETNPLKIIAEMLTEKYGRVCKIETVGSGYAEATYLVLYEKRATEKQIRYKRHEVADTICVHDLSDGTIMYNDFHEWEWKPLPESIDDVYNIIISKKRIV